MKRFVAAPAVLTVVLAVSMAGCAEAPRQIEADYAVHQSVSSLTYSSDVVVVGRVGSVVAREVDGGGDSENRPGVGLPMVFHHVEVTRTMSGSPGRSVIVAWPDSRRVSMEGATPVSAGEELVLFLERLSPAQAPGITSVRDFYVPVSGDNGVFDVQSSDTVYPRSDEVLGLTSGGRTAATSDGSFHLSEIQQTVRQYS